MARARNKYRLPLKKSDIKGISKHKMSLAHEGDLKYAIDFICDTHSSVYAAASGKVVWIKKDSNMGGPNQRRYWLAGNRIVIKHKNNEYSAYEHLKYKGVVVKRGQQVRKGQLIGYSGNTGFSFFPHLHFEVFNQPSKDESEGKTLHVSFG